MWGNTWVHFKYLSDFIIREKFIGIPKYDIMGPTKIKFFSNYDKVILE